ncbi:hypothetical protein ABD05_31280 [Burkholderia pyrrocinia]|nr:hypothetical protein ABD05_31280 [Burkholderia pyrrocinia]
MRRAPRWPASDHAAPARAGQRFAGTGGSPAGDSTDMNPDDAGKHLPGLDRHAEALRPPARPRAAVVRRAACDVMSIEFECAAR